MKENFSKKFLGPFVRNDTASEIKTARKEENKEKAKQISQTHHDRAKQIAETVEFQNKERSVSEWVKKGLVFAHGMPLLENQKIKSAVTGNNLEIKGKNLNARERLNIILEKSPPLSVSTLSGKRYNMGAAYPAGVLLADGFIQQGYTMDEGTTALDSETRVSMYKNPQDRVKVQKTVDVESIEKESDRYGQEILEKGAMGYMYTYNEYVIAKPIISSLYIDLDYFDGKKQIATLEKERARSNLGPASQQDQKYLKESADKELKDTLLALKNLSAGTGLPIIGLRSSEGGTVKKTKIELNDQPYEGLRKQAEALDVEIERLFDQGKSSTDIEVKQKEKQLMTLRLKIQSTFKNLSFSESPIEKLTAGQEEAEYQRQQHLLKEIKSL